MLLLIRSRLLYNWIKRRKRKKKIWKISCAYFTARLVAFVLFCLAWPVQCKKYSVLLHLWMYKYICYFALYLLFQLNFSLIIKNKTSLFLFFLFFSHSVFSRVCCIHSIALRWKWLFMHVKHHQNNNSEMNKLALFLFHIFSNRFSAWRMEFQSRITRCVLCFKTSVQFQFFNFNTFFLFWKSVLWYPSLHCRLSLHFARFF